MKELKLVMELVPATSWNSSLARMLPRPEWQRIRAATLQRSGNRCEICGGGGTLYCHEVWEYDDTAHLQRLQGFRAICRACNAVTHFGRSATLARQGKLDLERVIRHFLRINGCGRAVFEEHAQAAFAAWEARSKVRWTIELGQYARWLKQGQKRQKTFPNQEKSL